VVYAGDELHQVAVLSIGGLPWAGKRFRLLLAVQESREEGGGVAAFTQGGGEAPGGTGGIAVVVKIEVALTNCWKAGEAIDGTGGQGGGAAALAGATGVSTADSHRHTQTAQSSSAWASTVFTASS
jgi:hypothetical protein